MLSNTQNQRYITGIDGLRAFAVLAVVAYHFSFSWAGGGFLGVDVFLLYLVI
jgi:peptidoglycan/LPS O-acetylase OafA/YrhL